MRAQICFSDSTFLGVPNEQHANLFVYPFGQEQHQQSVMEMESESADNDNGNVEALDSPIEPSPSLPMVDSTGGHGRWQQAVHRRRPSASSHHQQQYDEQLLPSTDAVGDDAGHRSRAISMLSKGSSNEFSSFL